MKKSLVTGGAGFIGSHLVDKLVALGHEVVVIDNLSTGKKENVNVKARLIIKDIRDDLSDVFEKEKFDCVFHLAAQMSLIKSFEKPKEVADTNILGSLNLIENCIKFKVQKFIFSSSGGALYSPKAELPCIEESQIDPQSPYGLSKLTVENYLKIMKEIFGLDFVSLRYANVYGPRQDAKGEAGVVSIFINNILNKKDLTIFGDGEQTRDFVCVGDVADSNVIAVENELSGIFNVSSGKELSVNSLANKIKDLMNSDANVVHGKVIKGEMRRSCLSSEKLKSYNWKPKVDLDSGLMATVDWFKN